ncbi:SANT domain-containing protein 2 [Gossypium australe]|uniref:SANT domain-containing protein 2 n=1 Tax=Gossypium australe TaxID=47621 RepID=A0A5B6WL80_9ROSI|nr:SANT domain-containing protein 2 [Gossypium australe]
MTTIFSPGRSPGSSRLQLGTASGVSRLRSPSLKKPPEPLRRAVADCLSSSSSSSFSPAAGAGGLSSYHHGSQLVLNEASRTLRDYLAAPSTTDQSYIVILEHTIAERERSPAVVGRCVALLKRYLLRYKPSEETLLQIDRFCVSLIAECDLSPNRRLSPWSRSLNQQSGLSATSTSSASASPLLPVSSFASVALVKSLHYVRSLVAQHIPKRSFQPAGFAGATLASRQSLPSLTSLLSRSFNSQRCPVNVGESSEKKDATALSVSNFSNIEDADRIENPEYIAHDVLKWRWLRDHQSPFTESDHSAYVQDMSGHNFLEVGAAALLVGDMEAKMNGQPWKYFGTADMPYLDQLLQPSPVATIANSASARSHLRAITALKRSKGGPHQIWDDSPASTFRPRARPLFQYRHYSEQQPLRLNPAEVCEVIAAVCSETSLTNANTMTVSSRLSNNSAKPSMDVAVSVLIKLVIDMYVLDSGTAAPLTLSMLEEMLSSPRTACRVRAFDLILNLAVHAHLLEPLIIDDNSAIEEEYSQELLLNSEDQLTTQGRRKLASSKKLGRTSAIDKFESWILNILYDILLLLVQIDETEEAVWASALSCLLYFVCDRGNIWRNRLKGLDIRVVKSILVISRINSWAEVVHCKLVCILTNMLYQVPDESTKAIMSTANFLVDQLDLIGGIDFIFIEYSLSTSREERKHLYLVLFDYVLHQINETCISTGASEYSDDEIQPIAALLTLADAPEAYYISVKLGVEGIGELLRRSLSTTLDRYPNSERLHTLLENITEKLDRIISSFTHLDTEFFQLKQITKSNKLKDNVEGSSTRNSVAMKAKLAWSILHSLLHSDRILYRQNGFIWLGDLLIAEISDSRNGSIWSNVRSLQNKIAYAGVHDSSDPSDIPLSIWLMCGLLKSKNNSIRWGFLVVLERLLMRCKFLLDESEMQQPSNSDVSPDNRDTRLEKAITVIDIMSSALSLVAQINETDRINILKMCDILFSQLCLKVPNSNLMPFGEGIQRPKVFTRTEEIRKTSNIDFVSQQESCPWDQIMEETDSKSGYSVSSHFVCETASMAALLLRGQAIAPMQLVARVPAALFYWPLIQLAGAATDNIALGVAVGSKGRGNLPGATSDIRATLLLLLVGKCTADPTAFQEVGGEEFFRELLDDTDSRVAYYSSAFLLKRMMTEKPEKYQHMLQKLIYKAQQSNNEKLLENPYLQMRGIFQLSNEL